MSASSAVDGEGSLGSRSARRRREWVSPMERKASCVCGVCVWVCVRTVRGLAVCAARRSGSDFLLWVCAEDAKRKRISRHFVARERERCIVKCWRCRGLLRVRNKSSEPRLNLSGSWQQGHSAAYNTPFLIQVVCKGFIGPGPEIVIARGSGVCYRRSWRPRAGGGFPSGMDSNLEAFSYNPAHGSVAASPFPAAAIPMVRIGGSSRTEPNYR